MPNQITIINRSNIAWVLVILAALWIIFSQWKSCGKDAETQQQYASEKHRADSFANINQQQQARFISDSIKAYHKIDSTHTKLVYTETGKDSIWMAFSKLQKQYNGLSGRIFAAPIVQQDTGVWIVPDSYKKQCDSCATALQIGSQKLDSLHMIDSLNTELYRYEIDLRNKYTQDVSAQLDSCFANSARQNKAWDESLDKMRPRGSLWFGGEGTNSVYYTSFGAVIAFQGKNGRMEYSLSGGPILQGNYYLQARVIAKIKLRK